MKKLIIVSLLLGLFASCMTAEKHLQKFYDKGGELESVEREVIVHDTIPGTDSIVERLVKVPCPEPTPPKTRWEVRFDNKRFKDSLKHIRKTYNDSLDHQLKVLQERNDLLSDSLTEARKIAKFKERTERVVVRKESSKSWLFWLGFIAGAIAMFVTEYLIKRVRS